MRRSRRDRQRTRRRLASDPVPAGVHVRRVSRQGKAAPTSGPTPVGAGRDEAQSRAPLPAGAPGGGAGGGGRDGGPGGAPDFAHPAAHRDSRFEMTVGAFLARQRSGALHEGPRAELVAGRVVAGASLVPGEAAALVNLTAAFARAGLADLGVDVVAWAPLRLGPIDLVRAALVLLPGPAFFDEDEVAARWTRRPRSDGAGIGGSFDPAGTLLVVETPRAGTAQQARLASYAAAGAREVWLLDTRRGWVESLRSPWRSEYRSRTLWYPGEFVPVSALIDVTVEALIPP